MQFKTLAFNYMRERANFKHSTLKNYRSILSAHLLPKFGDMNVEDITVSDLRLFQVSLAEKLAGSRVNTVMQLLRTIIAEAYRENLITTDPCKQVKKVRQVKPKVEPFTHDELEKLWKVVDRHYLPLFQTLYLTGMRPNEAFALTWEDVDFDSMTINIDKGLVDGVEDSPKTESSERIIPMVTALEPILRKLQKPSGRVFTNEDGTEITWELTRVWKRACEKAEVPYRKPYSLRHSMATHAIMKGLAPGYVSKLLGHSSLAITLSFYARWIVSKEQEDQFRKVMS